MTRGYHIAQANIARMRAPKDDPVMAGFVARIETLNALADASPGFVWRLQDEAGDATSVQAFDDERILFNLSVWESIDALEAYVYRSDHVAALRQRADWFKRPDKAPLVLWWIEAGHIPNVAEAEQRFETLWRDGPGKDAFTFSARFARDD